MFCWLGIHWAEYHSEIYAQKPVWSVNGDWLPRMGLEQWMECKFCKKRLRTYCGRYNEIPR